MCGDFGSAMENELLDLADRLCTVVGMIMEDNNLIAVSTPKSSEERLQRLLMLVEAGDEITKLIAAAKVLVRLG